MKRLILLVIGGFPLALGYIQDFLMLKHNVVFPQLLIGVGIAMLAIWFFIGVFSVKLVRKKIEAILLQNAFAVIALLLALFQMLVLGQYWFNQFGLAPQLFYLPFISLGIRIIAPFTNTIYTYYGYVTAFPLLLVASYCGRVVGERRK